jgi:hypothetical protein
MGKSKELSLEEKARAKEFFAKNPWIGQSHTAKLARGAIFNDNTQPQPAAGTTGAYKGATGR